MFTCVASPIPPHPYLPTYLATIPTVPHRSLGLDYSHFSAKGSLKQRRCHIQTCITFGAALFRRSHKGSLSHTTPRLRASHPIPRSRHPPSIELTFPFPLWTIRNSMENNIPVPTTLPEVERVSGSYISPFRCHKMSGFEVLACKSRLPLPQAIIIDNYRLALGLKSNCY